MTWPAFLGAGSTLSPKVDLPTSWSHDQGVAWHVATVGHGQSSPVVWGNKLFLTSISGPNKEKLHLTCINLVDGNIVWSKQFDSSFPEKNSVYISRAAPTPVVDANAIYASFESGDIFAVTHEGAPLWHLALTEKYEPFQARFGLAASPAQSEELIYVLVDHEGPSYLVAFDKKSGKEVWKQSRSSRVSWTSPMLVTLHGIEQVVCSSAGSVDAYQAQTGELLWSFDEVGGNSTPAPIVVGDHALLLAASPGRSGDNAASARVSNGMLEVELKEGEWSASMAWTTKGAMNSFNSPGLHQGYAYYVNRAGVLYCFDVLTGEKQYTERLAESCWATPLGFKDRVYLIGKDGVTSVIKAGPVFELLSENRLWDPEHPPEDHSLPAAEEEPTEQRRNSAGLFSKPVQYGVAVSEHGLLIRVGTELYCVQ